ncbi:monocarboxylate transporter 12-B-like [Mya arenaria]|uniref:monocarboxylate transporter 12-B-like n=1 Tax=Mya arenaria TaxID=6604 RepID=UPI0022E489AB|nr:monocarboxylate transporter 12-B-like [Mya arenaria]
MGSVFYQETCECQAELVVKKGDPEDDCFEDLDTGWAWMVLIASFLTFCLVGAAIYAVGITHAVLLDKYGASVAVTSWAGALHSALNTLGAPLSSLLIDRFSCRVTLVLSGVCYTVGFLATAYAPNIYIAIFTCGILAGTGGALGYTASMVVVGFNFRSKRNLALGISNAGIGFGLFALAPVMQKAREEYGSTGYFLIMAGLTANIVTFGMLCFPSELELHTHRTRNRKEKDASERCSFLKSYFMVLSNKGILVLCISMMLFCVGTYLAYMYLPSFIVSTGISARHSALLISLSGIFSIAGRILTGIVSSKFHANVIVIYCGSICAVAISLIVYPFISKHFIGHVIFVVIYGLLVGSPYVVAMPVSLMFIEMQHLAVSLGLQFSFGGIGAIVGPVIAGILVDHFGNYEMSFIVAGVCVLVSGIVGILSVRCKRAFKQSIEVNVDDPKT